jgi:hypothetical protein
MKIFFKFNDGLNHHSLKILGNEVVLMSVVFPDNNHQVGHRMTADLGDVIRRV